MPDESSKIVHKLDSDEEQLLQSENPSYEEPVSLRASKRLVVNKSELSESKPSNKKERVVLDSDNETKDNTNLTMQQLAKTSNHDSNQEKLSSDYTGLEKVTENNSTKKLKNKEAIKPPEPVKKESIVFKPLNEECASDEEHTWVSTTSKNSDNKKGSELNSKTKESKKSYNLLAENSNKSSKKNKDDSEKNCDSVDKIEQIDSKVEIGQGIIKNNSKNEEFKTPLLPDSKKHDQKKPIMQLKSTPVRQPLDMYKYFLDSSKLKEDLKNSSLSRLNNLSTNTTASSLTTTPNNTTKTREKIILKISKSSSRKNDIGKAKTRVDFMKAILNQHIEKAKDEKRKLSIL